jgi:hypothetical protein
MSRLTFPASFSRDVILVAVRRHLIAGFSESIKKTGWCFKESTEG